MIVKVIIIKNYLKTLLTTNTYQWNTIEVCFLCVDILRDYFTKGGDDNSFRYIYCLYFRKFTCSQ